MKGKDNNTTEKPVDKIDFTLIPMSDIRPECRDIAVRWHESATNWIGDKVKLASDIQNYADWYAKNDQPIASESVEQAAEQYAIDQVGPINDNWSEDKKIWYRNIISNYKQSYIAGHTANTDLDKVREWVSVEDRLPEADGSYLVVIVLNEFSTQAVSRYIKSENIFQYKNVTHWMLLPEPPTNPNKQLKQ